MKSILAAAVAAGLAAWAMPAVAADPVDWTGFYLGVMGGAGHEDVDYTSAFEVVGVGTVVGPSGSFDLDGYLGGVQAGYDAQLGQFVFGGVVDVAGSNIAGDTIPDPLSNFNSVLTSNVDWMSTARGRIGVAMGQFLLYGTGGLVMVHASAHDTNIGFGYDKGAGSNTFFGSVVGAGAEMALGQGFSIFGQALYTSLDEGDIVFAPAPLTGTNTSTGWFLETGLNKRL